MRPGASALRVGGSTRRWRRLRAAQLVREPICQVLGCDRPAVEVDHLVARVDGGTDDPDNLVSLCREDHHLRHAGVELRIQESAPLPVGGPPWIA
jgi:5-methylcytosine-specific restriction endonuclease McrA